MERHDHLLRQIDQLGMVLRSLLTGLLGQRDPGLPQPPSRGEAAITIGQAEQQVDEALHLAPGTLALLSPEDLLTTLQGHALFNAENMEHLADLLTAMADATADPTRQRALYAHALAILEYLNMTGTTFDLERHTKVARLRSLV